MSDVLVPRNVRLTRAVWDDLDAYARNNGISKSDAIRLAVAALIDDDSRSTQAPNAQRLAVCTEYSQLALAVLLEKMAPEMVERVKARLAERMADHHGA